MILGQEAGALFTFDLDSTLADTRHRHHMIDPEGRTDWRAYSLACGDDKPIHSTLALARALQAAGHPVWIVSGRDAAALTHTRTWFRRSAGFTPDGYVLDSGGLDYATHEEYKVKAVALAEALAGRPHALHVDDWPPVARALNAAGRECLIVTPPKILDGFTPSGHLTYV